MGAGREKGRRAAGREWGMWRGTAERVTQTNVHKHTNYRNSLVISVAGEVVGSKDSDSDTSEDSFAALMQGGGVLETSRAVEATPTPATAPAATHEGTQLSSVCESQEQVLGDNSLDKASHKMLSGLPARMILGLIDAAKMMLLFTITWATVFSGVGICGESIDSTLSNFAILWKVRDDLKDT